MAVSRCSCAVFLVVCGALGAGISSEAAEQDKSAQYDRLVLYGLEDPTLDFEGANALLNVGFFGKPLRDAAFGRRTCEGAYPAVKSGSSRGGGAESSSDYAREIASRVISSTTELSARANFPRHSAASFARLVGELRDAGDLNAIEDLLSSPALVSFLLDPREPGYCRRVLAGSSEDRVSRASEFGRAGIRRLGRVEPASPDFVLLYLYRPRRLIDFLQGAAHDPSPPGADGLRGRLGEYAASLKLLERSVWTERDSLDPYSFPSPKPRSISILDSERNRLPPDLKYAEQMNMPIEMGALRRDIAAGKRRPSFSPERWRALELLAASCPALAQAQDFFVLRVVTEPTATAGRYVWLLGDDRLVGVSIQLAALDRVSRIGPKNRRALNRELDFISGAAMAAQEKSQ